MLRTVQNGELPGRACCLNGQYVSRGGKNHGLAASFLTQVGVAQATEGPTRVLSKIITTGGLNAPALPPARPRARVC